MIRAREDFLMTPVHRLAEALAVFAPGHERDWADNIDRAIGELQLALGQHASATEAADGWLTEVDLTRPTLVRQVNELCQEHTHLFEQTRALQAQVRNVLRAFETSPAQAVPPDALPKPAAVVTVPDFGAIRQDGEKLVAALQHHHAEETKLVLESVSTDIGVGD
jgi:hypothetical protein